MPDINGIPYVESSDLVSAYPAASQALAQEVSDQLASKLPYEYGTATPTTSVDGFLWYDDNDTPPTPKFWDGAAFQAIGGGGGKLLQIVRATDSTLRTTTSTTYTDVTGMSITITPTENTSAILLFCTFHIVCSGGTGDQTQLTDSSNNAISGAERGDYTQGTGTIATMLGYSTPASTSAQTYKLRFRSPDGNTCSIRNDLQTGQLIALELGA